MPRLSVAPGQKLQIPAEEYSRLLRMEREFTAERQRVGRGTARREQADSQTFAWVYNGTGYNLQHGEIIGIDFDANPIDPAYDGFHEVLMLRGEMPTTASHTGAFGVTQEPIPAGEIGKVCVAGATRCRLNVSSASDTFAEVTNSSVSYLTTSTTGSAKILYKQTGTGQKWGVVRLGHASASTAEPILYYYLSCDQDWSGSGSSSKLLTGTTVGYFGASYVLGDESSVGIAFDSAETDPKTNGNWEVNRTGLYAMALEGGFGINFTGAAEPTVALTFRRKPAAGAIAEYADSLGGNPAGWYWTGSWDSAYSGSQSYPRVPVSRTFVAYLTDGDRVTWRAQLVDPTNAEMWGQNGEGLRFFCQYLQSADLSYTAL